LLGSVVVRYETEVVVAIVLGLKLGGQEEEGLVGRTGALVRGGSEAGVQAHGEVKTMILA